jgi:hypothetical protein
VREVELDGYVTRNLGGRATLTVEADGRLSVSRADE